MTILSFGNFYLGIDPDSAPFFDLQVHFGIFRLEFGGIPPQILGPNTDASNRCSDGENLSGFRDASSEGP